MLSTLRLSRILSRCSRHGRGPVARDARIMTGASSKEETPRPLARQRPGPVPKNNQGVPMGPPDCIGGRCWDRAGDRRRVKKDRPEEDQ